MIINCVNDMKPSNSAGFDGISKNMIKKSKFLNETSSNQFGFQMGLSTYQPIFL
jgi:hypothetical protein